MSIDPTSFKTNQNTIALKGCSLDLVYFKKLYSLLSEINDEALQAELETLIITPSDTKENIEQYKKDVVANCALSIQIYSSEGDIHYYENNQILDDFKFPDNVKLIAFDNSIKFNNYFKFLPKNCFRVQFDFKKSKIFDLLTQASEATANASSVTVHSVKESWGLATQKRILDSIRGRINRRDWLHAQSIYDVFVFTLFLPLCFLVLYKLELVNFFNFFPDSRVLKVAGYIYAFLLSLVICRVVFNYGRWIFPKFELSTNSQKGSLIHRVFLGTIIFSIFKSFLWDLIQKFF